LPLAALWAALSLWLPITPRAQERDLAYNSEQLEIEAARHLFRIEGNAEAAGKRLQALLAGSHNEEILTQARFLLGRILDRAGEGAPASDYYRTALTGRGLQAPEKLWLYKRLLAMDPASVRPAVLDAQAKAGPAHIFPALRGKHTVYALEFRGPPDGQWERSKELGWQDENADYHPFDLRLTGREEVLDADPDRALVLNQDTRKVSLLPLGEDSSGPARAAVAAGPRIDVGALLAGEPDAFLLAGSGSLRVFQAGKPYWETPLDQEGCAWTPAPDRTPRGILQCADNQIYLVDARKKSLRPVAGITDKALQVAWQGDYLAVRYIDRFEVRKGPGFDIVKWGMPGLLQEKLVLGADRAYLITAKGQIRAYDLATGHPDWQRDAQASQLAVFGDALFATTFAQTISVLDARGAPQWNYEFGWDRRQAHQVKSRFAAGDRQLRRFQVPRLPGAGSGERLDRRARCAGPGAFPGARQRPGLASSRRCLAPDRRPARPANPSLDRGGPLAGHSQLVQRPGAEGARRQPGGQLGLEAPIRPQVLSQSHSP
jgi:hypothetical protein